MDIIKSKLSLSLLTTVSSAIKSDADKISISTNEDILFLLKDKNSNYDFFFRAESEKVEDRNTIAITFTCKPFSAVEKGAKSIKLPLPDFGKKLIQWIEDIKKYKTEKLIDDSIVKEYQEEFYKEYKIVDEDAETHRFNFPQQILLLNYVEILENRINEEEIEFTKEDKEELLQETK